MSDEPKPDAANESAEPAEEEKKDLPGKLQEFANIIDQRTATGRQYRLEDPKFVRFLIYLGIGVLSALVLAEAFYHHHAHFEKDGIKIDTYPEFFPVFGFLACLVMVVVSKAIGMLLKRKDTYYDAE